MATNGNRRQRGGAQQQRTPMSPNPVSDLMYDWLTVLQNKAEGINAYEKYIRDAEEEGDAESADLFRKCREQDIWQVKEIRQHLEQMLLEEEEMRMAGRGSFASARSGREEGEEE